jgi:hypothetical protein
MYETSFTWDETIHLPGYNLVMPDTAAGSLAVTFFWQTLDRMDASYTNFLHLIDPASGQIVAQADVIPLGWTYPTNLWEKGEIIEDTIHLSLAGLPPGVYDLFAGWYDLDTGERLPAYSETGRPFVGQTVLLTTVEIPGN